MIQISLSGSGTRVGEFFPPHQTEFHFKSQIHDDSIPWVYTYIYEMSIR